MNWQNSFVNKNIYYKTNTGIVYNDDIKYIITQFPNESIDMVITSPPYWSLRDYGVKNQIGLEKDFQDYLENLWFIFKEIYRVLKPEGTCWINLGDTYMSNSSYSKKQRVDLNNKDSIIYQKNKIIKQKSLCMIPERFAIGMIERGWILRNQIIWKKNNALPSSVKDRFTVDFEKIFFFVKNKKYYFNQIKEPSQAKIIEKRMKLEKRENYNSKYIHQPKRTMWRNKRTVWTINTTPSKHKHIAPFPIEIPKICITAGCPENGIVLDPFVGSGTTLLAAEKLNRRWIGIEINKEYCEIAKRRINNIKNS